MAWTNAPLGSSTLTAKATDDKGTVTVFCSNSDQCGCKGKRCSNRKYHGSCSKRPVHSGWQHQYHCKRKRYRRNNYQSGVLQRKHLVGNRTLTAPYSLGWTNAPLGSSSLTAKATDDKGTATVSAPISDQCGCKGKRCSNRKHHGSCRQTPSSLRVTTSASLQTQAIPTEQLPKWSSSTEHLLGTDTTTPYSYAWTTLRLEAPLWLPRQRMIKEPLLFLL